ncbi:paraquat-inducible protein A [Pelagicoccus sp. SDUM812003]|uniref:paraquat-inducible protein A n=1 Tax=Pelagicoccus sp. SDUM812003 TaxID=3041267 RepID=UPI00280F193E|nr:paraquat-inducible protein A [Pelagicoccus sp. SDUM812003]MDQ8205251.1 paraquat-inducible protein A [Pelagicoccus sp. SDUM812003]
MDARSPNPPSDIIKELSRRQRLAAAILLSLSFLCNILALVLPFMKIRSGVTSTDYSLPGSVLMLWEENLFALAFLVLFFSIAFPFAKIGTLAFVTARKELTPESLRWLMRVERFGKWSMLDVFLVSIILSLASRQFFVSARPELGLTLFIVAIALSMIAGEILAYGAHSAKTRLPSESRKRGGALLALSTIGLLAALSLPFLRIDDWLLADRSYSILSLVPALWGQDAKLAASLSGLFLVATPLCAMGLAFKIWIRSRRGNPSERSFLWFQRLQRWSMLDVFGLALAVFALESDSLMQTEIHWGALFLGCTLVLQMLFAAAFEIRVKAPRSKSSPGSRPPSGDDPD